MNGPFDILVAGAGAIGSVFACLLSAAGHRVTALGRGKHLAAMAGGGIELEGIWGSHSSRGLRAASSAAELDDDYDAVLVTCKSFQTGALLDAIGNRVRAGGRVISLQNGLGNVECIAAVCGREQTLAARVIFGGEILRPGRVRVTVEADSVLVGNVRGGADASAEHWARVFDEAGINCRPTDSIMAALWGKVFYNAALNPMGALLGLTYGELVADELRRRVMNRVMEEAFAVARAEGVALPWRSAEDYIGQFYERLIPPTVEHRSSMLQDIERGKPTEIDAICGEVCRRGEAAGVDVACNRMLLALVRARSERANGREEAKR